MGRKEEFMLRWLEIKFLLLKDLLIRSKSIFLYTHCNQDIQKMQGGIIWERQVVLKTFPVSLFDDRWKDESMVFKTQEEYPHIWCFWFWKRKNGWHWILLRNNQIKNVLLLSPGILLALRLELTSGRKWINWEEKERI